MPLTDITHVFYVTWGSCHGWSNIEAHTVNRAMLSTVLSAVIPNALDLKHVTLQSNRNQSADPFQPPVRGAFAKDGWLSPFSEDLSRPDYTNLETPPSTASLPVRATSPCPCTALPQSSDSRRRAPGTWSPASTPTPPFVPRRVRSCAGLGPSSSSPGRGSATPATRGS